MTVKNNNRADRGANKKAGNSPRLTAEEKKRILAKQLRLRPKTVAMVDMLLENPKLTQTEAYMRTHDTDNRKNAGIQASKILNKPSVQIYKDSAVRKAKSRIVSLVDSENESIALKAATDIIDRTEGKAVQKNETTTKTVEVKLDLTGVKLGNHYIKPEMIE